MLRRNILLGGLGLGLGAAASAHSRIGAPSGKSSTGSKPDKVIFQADEGEHLVRRAGPMGGLPFTIKVDGRNGGARDIFVFTETLAPGQMIPWHRHDTCEEVMMIEEGGVTVTVGMERVLVGARSIAFMPMGVWHSATNTSSHPVHLTSIYSGQDFDPYMRAISVPPGVPVVPINPEELPRLRALGHATYWDTKLGPFPPGVARP